MELISLSVADIITASEPFANTQTWSQGRVDIQDEQI